MSSAGGGMSFYSKKKFTEKLLKGKDVTVLDNESEYPSNHRAAPAPSEEARETFLGYCYRADGRYYAPVHLDSLKQAVWYLNLQKALQYRVIITDSSDSIVAEAIKGEIVFPKAV